jgi:hypothetical protein
MQEVNDQYQRMLERQPVPSENGILQNPVIKPQLFGIYTAYGQVYDHEFVVKAISDKHSIQRQYVEEILFHNFLTVDSLALICGVSTATIRDRCEKRSNAPAKLQIAYPFMNHKKRGPMLIYRDELCEKYILKRLGITVK